LWLPQVARASRASSIRYVCFFPTIPAQVIFPKQVPAARRLRAVSFPLRAGNARRRAAARWQRISTLTTEKVYA
jgi:hypothetical protein